MNHSAAESFRDQQWLPLQAAVVFELVKELESSTATHLVLKNEAGDTRTIAVDTFIEDCRQRGRALQQQLAKLN